MSATNDANGIDAALTASITDFVSRSYDFVICGGGTAGLVLAARLSEDSRVTVGVIEAGQYKQNDFMVDTPGVFPKMFGDENYDWKFKTTPQVCLKPPFIILIASKSDSDPEQCRWQTPSYSPWQDVGWFKWNQLYDVRSWLHQRLQ